MFFVLFAVALAAVTGGLTLTGLGFEPAMVLAIAALTTTGPLVSLATDHPVHWWELGAAAKVIAGGAMIVGRLEVLAVLALLAPATWRR